MAYREVAMWEILEVLRRMGRGETQASVSRTTGHTRKTIRRYLATAAELGWEPGPEEPTEALAAAVFARHRPAADRGPGEAEARLLPHREQIRTWLTPGHAEKRGLRLTKVRELLRRRNIDVPYTSLHRFAVQHCGFSDRRRTTVRMAEWEPGEVAEVDFGKLGLIPFPETGKRRVAWEMPVVLPHSRHQYVHMTHSQAIPDLIDGLENAWEFFGGVPRRVILDNLKAAVIKGDRYEPIFQRTFEEYARYRGFIIDPAPVRMPTGKPFVERSVSYVRDSLFRGETWRDLEHLQERAIVWCRETAGTRIHGTTRQRPLAVFEDVERPALQPLTAERFDPPQWACCKVHPDHHIQFDKALYSVPHAHLGGTVWVRADRKLVRVYHDGVVVKTHARQRPGARATDYDDYPTELTAYALRDPKRMIRQAEQLGPEIGRFMTELLSGDVPWARLRQAQKLLRMAQKYGASRLDMACRRALAFELVNVRRLETIVRDDLAREDRAASSNGEASVIPIEGRFLRASTSFSHTTSAAQEATHD